MGSATEGFVAAGSAREAAVEATAAEGSPGVVVARVAAAVGLAREAAARARVTGKAAAAISEGGGGKGLGGGGKGTL